MFILGFVSAESSLYRLNDCDRSGSGSRDLQCIRIPSVNCNVFHRGILADNQELANQDAIDSAVSNRSIGQSIRGIPLWVQWIKAELTLIDQGLQSLDIWSHEGTFQLIDQLRRMLSAGNQPIERLQLYLDWPLIALAMEDSKVASIRLGAVAGCV